MIDVFLSPILILVAIKLRNKNVKITRPDQRLTTKINKLNYSVYPVRPCYIWMGNVKVISKMTNVYPLRATQTQEGRFVSYVGRIFQFKERIVFNKSLTIVLNKQ